MQFTTIAALFLIQGLMTIASPLGITIDAADSTGNLKERSVYPTVPPFTGTHSGDGTWFDDGLGACGYTNTGSQLVVAISHILYDSYPGYTGTNPNNNPVCGTIITASYGGKSVDVEVVDRCTGCAEFDLDFSQGAFEVLAALSVGRIYDVEWSWV